MLKTIYLALLVLAIAGDARIFLFVMNRIVFGGHKEEKAELHWLMYAVPPLLVFLTLLFWPLSQWVRWAAAHDLVERVTPAPFERIVFSLALAKLGASWLFIAAGIGAYWIVDRIRTTFIAPKPVPGTTTLPSRIASVERRRDEGNAGVERRQIGTLAKIARAFGAHNDVNDIEVTQHEVSIADLPPEFDGYRIAFLTDTHVAPFMRPELYRAAVAEAVAFSPDLILLGGDFVTWQKHIPLLAEVLLPGLTARDGVFAVLGNHDYWANAEQVMATMRAGGVEFLINRSIAIQRGSAQLALLGIDEIYRGHPDPDAAFSRVDPHVPCLGISHHPDIIDRLDGRRIDLLVCGHTHGGQIRFPLFGSVVVPSKHEGRYAAGFQREGGVLMYVSRGVGAIPPLRILCRPEVATFVLRRSA
ncbi:MAG TPA: metallophosphoesterase [Thermoanaerobaculia bacterium]|nr:metallophosphoesterase [Thermoanaerobaculia bacterium]